MIPVLKQMIGLMRSTLEAFGVQIGPKSPVAGFQEPTVQGFASDIFERMTNVAKGGLMAATPLGITSTAAQGLASIFFTQQNTTTVHGARDPGETARRVGIEQDRANQRATRLLQGAVR